MKKLTEMYFPNLGELSTFSIISILGSGIAQEIFHETIHGMAVVATAIIAAVCHHLARYYMNKKFPLKNNGERKEG